MSHSYIALLLWTLLQVTNPSQQTVGSGVNQPPTAAGTAFTFSQVKSTVVACGTGTTTCNFSVTSTCATCVGLITANNNQASFFISSVSGGGTWVVPAGCQNYAPAITGSVSCAYVLSETAATTSITVTWNATATSIPGLYYAEASWTGSAPALDFTGGNYNGVNSSSQNGQVLTLTATNEFCMQVINISGAQPTAITAGYTMAAIGSAGGQGVGAYNVAATATTPVWTIGVSDFANVGAVCIK